MSPIDHSFEEIRAVALAGGRIGMRNMILLVVVLLAALPALALPVKVSVLPGNTDQAAQDAAAELAGKIGSTSRYALVTKGRTDIVLFVDCLPNVVGDRQVGVTCHTTLTFFPVDNIGLCDDLQGTMSAGNLSHVVQDLFNSFVQETSDEKLAADTAEFKHYLNTAITRYPNGIK